MTQLVNGTDVFAVLHYAGASSAEPITPQPVALPPGGVPFQEFNLVVRPFTLLLGV